MGTRGKGWGTQVGRMGHQAGRMGTAEVPRIQISHSENYVHSSQTSGAEALNLRACLGD